MITTAPPSRSGPSKATDPSLRVLLVGNFVPDRQQSMQRFARLLADGLAARGCVVEMCTPQPWLTRLCPNYRYRGLGKYLGYYDKFVRFPRILRHRLHQDPDQPPAADLVHIADHANAVYLPAFGALPALVTCHDLLQIRAARGEFVQQPVGRLGRRYQQWILDHLARTPFAVSVSHQTDKDLARLTDLPATRRTVIHNGLNQAFRRLPHDVAVAAVQHLVFDRGLDRSWLCADGAGFLFNLGGGQWYKNRRGVLQIYRALHTRLAPPPRLLLAGKPLSAADEAYAEEALPHDSWRHIGPVSEAELQALYSLAQGLIFPSWQEGFGWPVAEAQACGCPVFTSNRAPLTEVGGAGAVYFDPADPEEAANAIAAAWPEREALAEAGRAEAARWDPVLMHQRYHELYTRLAQQRAARKPSAAPRPHSA